MSNGIGYSSCYKGIIKIKDLQHPEKYSDTEDIVYRSKLEMDFMFKFDRNPAYLKWASEPRFLGDQIKYVNPISEGRISRYFPDFLIKMKTRSGEIVNVIAEIKPQKELDNAVNLAKLKQNTKPFWRALQNVKKWDSAISFCKLQTDITKERWEFIVLTEEDLKKMP